MAEVIDFKGRKKKSDEKKIKDAAVEDYTEGASFWDDDIDPSIVFDVIGNDKMRLAFITMLVVMRQISTMGEFTIAVGEDGVRFDSSNSIAVDEPEGDFQVHTNLMKQGYLQLDSDHALVDLQRAADSLGMLLQSLILYKDEDLYEDDDDDTE